MVISHRKDDFQQRVVASIYPHDPSLEAVAHLFPDKDQVPVDKEMIFHPSTPEEFEQMLEMMDELAEA